ncbi:hypothetical protein [Novosphingobium sp. SG916]|uniref:hypothetical protein n=1 Tax=unclassified Novosphingobium TaxID=2644732 RepID=UPI0032B70238
MRSTTELQQHTISAKARHTSTGFSSSGGWPSVEARYWPQALPKSSGVADKKFPRQRTLAMTLSKTPPRSNSREERLAQRLRENLRRRKAQARALNEAGQDASAEASVEPGADPAAAPLGETQV